MARDQAEVTEQFGDLTWHDKGAGGWSGRLPRWPFERPDPPRLVDVIGDGLRVIIEYGHAYPMVPPLVYPRDPEPEILQRTDHRWHVNGDGSLCLLQDDTAWSGRDTIVDLLLKAAGWRVEYALMKAGVIEEMTLHGIVEDAQNDYLVDAVAAMLVQPGEQSDVPA